MIMSKNKISNFNSHLTNMRKLKILLRVIAAIILIVLIYAVHYTWVSFPIISGFGAKDLCSCMFVGNRSEEDVKKEELGAFPFTLGSYTVNGDSSVTGSVWGMATQKAIYRKGIGCTLVNDIDEKTLRSQSFVSPAVPSTNRDSIPWPMGDKITDSVPSNIDMNQI